MQLPDIGQSALRINEFRRHLKDLIAWQNREAENAGPIHHSPWRVADDRETIRPGFGLLAGRSRWRVASVESQPAEIDDDEILKHCIASIELSTKLYGRHTNSYSEIADYEITGVVIVRKVAVCDHGRDSAFAVMLVDVFATERTEVSLHPSDWDDIISVCTD